MYIQCSDPCSGVARVAELGGQAGGKGSHQGGKHSRETQSADGTSTGGLRAAQVPLIKLTISGFKSSVVSRKICDLHTVKIALKFI